MAHQATTRHDYQIQHQQEAFEKSLPMYRMAMQICASAITDLNTAGSPRLEAMKWWCSQDQGLAQPEVMADVISRFHFAALSLSADMRERLSDVQVLNIGGGQVATVADLTNKEKTLSLLRQAAGIELSADNDHVLSNTGEARVGRARCMFGAQTACLKVTNEIQRYYGLRNTTPEQSKNRDHNPDKGWVASPTRSL